MISHKLMKGINLAGVSSVLLHPLSQGIRKTLPIVRGSRPKHRISLSMLATAASVQGGRRGGLS